MIRIDRGPEPPELPRARVRGLARAVLARRSGKEPDLEGYNLPEVRRLLDECQHDKCAYCECAYNGAAGHPMEHFRPRRGADRGDPHIGKTLVDRDRYWWLTWSWNNLFLACPTCNSAGFKGNRFPLVPGSRELPIPDGLLHDAHSCFMIGLERPLLLDPAWDDPLDHIAWRPIDPIHPDGQWVAFPKTERGRVTIQILGFDRRNVDRVGGHIRHVVRPWVKRVYDARERGDVDAAKATWNDAIANLFVPEQPFHAATYDALAYLVPSEVRASAGLDLPRPGAPPPIHADAMSAPVASISPSIAIRAGLPDDVVLHLLADEKTTPELLSLICQARPSSLDELAMLLDITEETVKGHCKALMGSGELAVDASGRYVPASASPATPK
jgi:hypothetical protein